MNNEERGLADHTERTEKGRNAYIILIGHSKRIYGYIISENTGRWDDGACAMHRPLISNMSPASVAALSEFKFGQFKCNP